MVLVPKQDRFIKYEGIFVVLSKKQHYNVACRILYSDNKFNDDESNEYYLIIPESTDVIFAISMREKEIEEFFEVHQVELELTEHDAIVAAMHQLPKVSTKGELKRYIKRIPDKSKRDLIDLSNNINN